MDSCVYAMAPSIAGLYKCGLCCRPTTRFSLMKRKMDTRRFRLQPPLLCSYRVLDVLYIPTSCTCAVNRFGVLDLVVSGNLLVGWPYRSGGYYLHRILSLAIQHVAAHGGLADPSRSPCTLRRLLHNPPECWLGIRLSSRLDPVSC